MLSTTALHHQKPPEKNRHAPRYRTPCIAMQGRADHKRMRRSRMLSDPKPHALSAASVTFRAESTKFSFASMSLTGVRYFKYNKTCAMPKSKPRSLGRPMKPSPTHLAYVPHIMEAKTVPRVNPKGMQSTDFVLITVPITDNGAPYMPTLKMSAAMPT